MKILKRILFLIATLVPVFLFASCVASSNPPQTQHVHSYSEKWSYNDVLHWREPTCDDTNEPSDKIHHVYSKFDECDVCGYAPEGTHGLEYRLINNGTAYEVKHNYKSGSVVIPSYYHGLPVTSIGRDSFRYSDITSVTIPESVTSIEYGAFMFCDQLTDVVILGNVEYIGDSAFSACESLRNINLTEGLVYIGNYCFSNASLESLDIPSSVEHIGDSILSGCNTVAYNVEDGIKYLGNQSNPYMVCFGFAEDREGVIEIRNGCKMIYDGAFTESSVERVVLPDTLYYIGDWAFYKCKALSHIGLTDAITYIGSHAFGDCTSLTVTELDGVHYLGVDGNPVFMAVDSNYGKTFSVAAGCRFVGSDAFSHNLALEEVSVPDSVIQLCGSSFYGSYNLKRIYIGRGVKVIGYQAFTGCKALADIQFADPDALTLIEASAFSSCEALTTFSLGNKIEYLSMDSFGYCKSLKSIYISASLKRIYGEGNFAFSGCIGLEKIVVDPDNPVFASINNCLIDKKLKQLLLAGKGATISPDADIEILGGSAFAAKTWLSEVEIPEGVVQILPGCFEGCTSLKSVSFPASCTMVSADAFQYCTALESITVAEGNVRYRAVDNCLIDTYCKEVCIGCKGSVIPVDPEITSIAMSAFRTSSIERVFISKYIIRIGEYAFEGCNDLVEIVVDDDNAVYSGEGNCIIEKATKKLLFGSKNTVIPSDGSVTTIAKYAFSCCYGLEQIVIPSAVDTIESNAFWDCINLKYIYIPASVTKVDWFAFGVHLLPTYCYSIFVEWDTLPVGWHPDWGWTSDSEFLYLKDEWSWVAGIPTPSDS